MIPRPPCSTLFPYTTLFRSRRPRPSSPAAITRARFPSAAPSHREHQSAKPETAAVTRRDAIARAGGRRAACWRKDRKSTRLNSSHLVISYAVFCLIIKITRFFLCNLFNDPATSLLYPLSLHDALPISTATAIIASSHNTGEVSVGGTQSPGTPIGKTRNGSSNTARCHRACRRTPSRVLAERSEEHTSELQSPCNLVCRLLLDNKNYSLFPL